MNISEKRDDFVIISISITKDQYRYARSMADMFDISVGEFLHNLLLNDMLSFDKAFKPSNEPIIDLAELIDEAKDRIEEKLSIDGPFEI